MRRFLTAAAAVTPFSILEIDNRIAPVATAIALAIVPRMALAAGAGSGSISLSGGTSYTQDFNGLASSGSSNALPGGWFFDESGTSGAVNGLYNTGTGSNTAGDVYSFGSSGSTDRALGTLRSGTLSPTIGAQFTNNAGATITRLVISYTGEQWRLGTSGRGADRLDFQLSTNASSLTSGTWTGVDALSFSSPITSGTVGALNGNLSANRTAITATLTGLSIPSGASFWIRWVDFDATSSDDGLAVDDFTITALVDDAAPFVTAISPPSGASGVPRSSNVVVTFSEPVSVTTSTFSLDCSASGNHTFALSNSADFTTWTLDPDVDFAVAESCAVTVFANGVSDLDTNDPPDHMVANFVTSFDDQQCGDPATKIHDIQGNGFAAAMSGAVTIEGIVTGNYQGAGQFGGYYVQEEDGDADDDPTTSEGIFVFSSKPVQRGDKVRVSGTIAEFANLTELNSVSNVLVCGSGYSVTPTVVTMPLANVSDWERYEGMLITIAQDLTVTENFSLGRFGEVSLSSGGRLYTPTAVTWPGAPALAQQAENDRRVIVLNDANGQQNIDPVRYPAGGLSASNTLRDGYVVHGVTGILEERFGGYRIEPLGPVAYEPSFDPSTNMRQASPNPVGGTVRVASMNVLNYFNGDGQGGGFPTARGASSLFEFNRQRAKTLAAIRAVNADVVGLSEVENDPDGPYSALQDIVNGLNDAAGPGTWDYIRTGVQGGDLIRSAIVYKPAVLTPLGNFAILDGSVDPRFIDRGNRPTMAQTFEAVANRGRFTLVVNHLRSKGSSCDSDTSPFNDPDIGDGQGNCNLVRTAAANAIVDWLATNPTHTEDADYLIVGDMNSYAKEDPITTFVTGGYADQVARFIGAGAYSYVFSAQSGYIDHALANSAMAAQVSGVAEYHNNADEPVVLDYNVEFKTQNQINNLFYAPDQFRASDHDPLLIGLNLKNDPPVASAGGPYSVDEGGSITLTATGSDPDGTAVTFAWDLDGDGVFETAGYQATYLAIDGPATPAIKVKVTDATGLSTVASANVTVRNVAPTLGSISAPAVPVLVNTAVSASVSFTDPGVQDTHTAAFDWGDGSTSAGSVTESSGSGTATASHSYTAAGIYTVVATVTDKDGGSGQQTYRSVVVYDPNAGFVTGGGWIDSPAGAYLSNPSLAGRANFGFVLKYLKGTSVPTGNTEFQFQAAGLNFHATGYEWLVVGGGKAQLKGVGQLNGAGSYGILITATDGGAVDTLRVRIWYSDSFGDHVVYDNGDQRIGGGNIDVKR